MFQHSEIVSISNSKPAMECAKSENSNLPRGLIGMRGLPIAKGTRLPSLRAPRDLTLGGVTKRIFTPNVSQCKERSKNNDIVTAVTKPERSGKNKNRTKEHAYKRTKNREYIQTPGAVFDGEPLCIKINAGHTANKRHSKSVKKTSPKVIPESRQTKTEDEDIQRLLRDDFIDDEDEDTTKKAFPTILPISNTVELQKQYFQKNLSKTDQDEDGSLSDSSLSKENKCFGINNTCKPGLIPSTVFSMDDLPKSGKLLLFQFPDCLPGIKKSDNTVKTEVVLESPELPQKRKGSVKKEEAAASSSKLADWPEGYLGKLRIHKSGKAYLSIGSLILDINISTSVGFLQELVSLKIKSNTGDMHVLGHVNDKVVCVPSAEALLAS